MYLSVKASPCSHAAPSRGGAAPAPASHVISGQKPGLPVQVSADSLPYLSHRCCFFLFLGCLIEKKNKYKALACFYENLR
jgi:hypothetical protein